MGRSRIYLNYLGIAVVITAAILVVSCKSKMAQAEALNLKDTPIQTIDDMFAGQTRNGHLAQEFFYQTMKIDIRTQSPLVYRYRFQLLHRGTCRVCGCTATRACTNPTHGNCWWVDETETLCSHCALPEIADEPVTFHPNHDRP